MAINSAENREAGAKVLIESIDTRAVLSPRNMYFCG